MNIKETFLKLTSKTYPNGTEDELFHLLPDNLLTDEHGNKYLKIGEPTVMFTSHLDTATSAKTDVTHVFDGKMIRTKDSILGADDKAGVTILMYMIEHNIPGLYYFFLGEEVGCIGSRKLAESETSKLDLLTGITKCVAFDRRGYPSVITHQMSRRTCSDDFAKDLSAKLNEVGMETKPDPSGICTDSLKFISIIPECTNISVGYFNEHTFNEHQDIEHLEKLANAVLKVDWESLTISRDPSKTEYSYSGGYSGCGYGYDEYDDYYGGEYGGYGQYNRRHDGTYTPRNDSGNGYINRQLGPAVTPDENETKYTYDNKFETVVKYVINRSSKKILTIELSKERIEFERNIIVELFCILDIKYSGFTWDGYNLLVTDLDWSTKTVDRNELAAFLPELLVESI